MSSNHILATIIDHEIRYNIIRQVVNCHDVEKDGKVLSTVPLLVSKAFFPTPRGVLATN